MPKAQAPKIALVWSQLVPHHVDRAAACAQRLGERAEVQVIEVASTSLTYGDWKPTGTLDQVKRVTLFPGQSFENVGRVRRFAALLRALLGCRIVCFGIGYNEFEILALSWILALLGKKVVAINDTKFDDRPRRIGTELIKRIGLGCYQAAIVAGARSYRYFRFLGFRRRPLLFGADGFNPERVRRDAGGLQPIEERRYEGRDFIFVGRFVTVKNLPLLIDAYASYVALSQAPARRLVLVGAGPLEEELRERVAAHALGDKVVFNGFCEGPELARLLASALALLLISYSETWGMVVSESLALGLPVIVTEVVGSRDLLVRDRVNGLVVENGSRLGLARAMLDIASNEARWREMCSASLDRAWLGDAGIFADAVELLLDPAAAAPRERQRLVARECNEFFGQNVTRNRPR